MKRPSFQFYPSDWLRDTALRSCSTGARGLWIDMICYMHEGNPYGYLKVGNKVIHPINLARMVGLTLNEVNGYLDELQEAGVFDIDEDGSIYSRRMIRDENLRKIRAEGGKLGGNPKLKDKNKVNHEDKQNTTPSSSSSSSSSIKRKKPTKTSLPEDFCISNAVMEWANKNGHSNLDKHLESFINKCKAKNYQYADWDSAFRNAISDNWAKIDINKPKDKMKQFWQDIESYGKPLQIGDK